MSAEDTLLVVHNPYGLQMQGGKPDQSSVRFVCYWLDHFLRPAGCKRAAVDTVHLKAASYDGRVIVQLAGDIDWDAPEQTQRLQRFLGEHRWSEIARAGKLRPAERGLSSFVFAFDRRLFAGRRLHVDKFGYTKEVPAPAVLREYDRATDSRTPLVHWETYPAAHWCPVPQRQERIELPIPKPPATPPPPAAAQPAPSSSPVPRQPSPGPSTPGPPVKTEPRDSSLPIPVNVKREPSEDVKPFLKFKMDPDEEEAMSKAARREQELDGVKKEESPGGGGSVKKEEDVDGVEDEDENVKPKVHVKQEAVDVKLEPKAEEDEDEERKPRIRVKRERSDSDREDEDEDVKPKLDEDEEDEVKPVLVPLDDEKEEVKPKLEEKEDVKPKVEEEEDANFWIKTESQGEEEDRKPLVKAESWSRSPSRRIKTSHSHSHSRSRSPSKRVKSEPFERDSKPPLRKRVKMEP